MLRIVRLIYRVLFITGNIQHFGCTKWYNTQEEAEHKQETLVGDIIFAQIQGIELPDNKADGLVGKHTHIHPTTRQGMLREYDIARKR